MTKVRWDVVANIGAFALQAVGLVWALEQSASAAQERMDTFSLQLTELTNAQNDTKSKVDYIYTKFFDKGFGQ